jgi:HAD superfamily hydrolase (TIGR01484 family)
MRYMALACDYDGTLATHGVVDDQTARALERCRKSGRKLLMVTGRELPELQEICPYLDLFEWIVAENGALLYRPATQQEIALAPPPTSEFVTALKQRGVERISIGRVIVATWEPHETTVLKTIRDLGLELQVIFNKGAVMILPSGINKATGLQRALTEIGLSPHNVVSVGDAENDHALLAGSEAGAAVANAVELLKEHADLVTGKTHGAGVSEVVARLIDDDLADLESKLLRHHVVLGKDAAGKDFLLSPYRSNIIAVEGSRERESTMATVFIRRLVEKCYQVCIINPTGHHANVPDCVSIGTAQQPPTIDAILKFLSSPSQSIVINLRGLANSKRLSFLPALIRRLCELRSRLGRPHWIVIEQLDQLMGPDFPPEDFSKGKLFDRTMFTAGAITSIPVPIIQTADLLFADASTGARVVEELATVKGVDLPILPQPALEIAEPTSSDQALIWPTDEPYVHRIDFTGRRNSAQPCAGQANGKQTAQVVSTRNA